MTKIICNMLIWAKISWQTILNRMLTVPQKLLPVPVQISLHRFLLCCPQISLNGFTVLSITLSPDQSLWHQRHSPAALIKPVSHYMASKTFSSCYFQISLHGFLRFLKRAWFSCQSLCNSGHIWYWRAAKIYVGCDGSVKKYDDTVEFLDKKSLSQWAASLLQHMHTEHTVSSRKVHNRSLQLILQHQHTHKCKSRHYIERPKWNFSCTQHRSSKYVERWHRWHLYSFIAHQQTWPWEKTYLTLCFQYSQFFSICCHFAARVCLARSSISRACITRMVKMKNLSSKVCWRLALGLIKLQGYAEWDLWFWGQHELAINKTIVQYFVRLLTHPCVHFDVCNCRNCPYAQRRNCPYAQRLH